MHKERYAVVARKTVYNTVYLLAVIVVLCCIVLELVRLVYVEKVVGVVNECLVTHLLAVVVDEYVAHYGIYPPFEIGVWSVFVHVAQCFQ